MQALLGEAGGKPSGHLGMLDRRVMQFNRPR